MKQTVWVGYKEVIRHEAWVTMSEEMADDLHDYGFYEIFCAAEQLWAIREGLADRV